MRANELSSRRLNELSYEGNIGMAEMFAFYQKATPEEKAKLQEYINKKMLKAAWALLASVTGTELKPGGLNESKGYPVAISNLLMSREIRVVTESIAVDIRELTDTDITVPFKAFKKDRLEDFAEKLYGWAIVTMHDLRKTADFDPNKHYVATLSKIINNPGPIAAQLFNSSVLALVQKQ